MISKYVTAMVKIGNRKKAAFERVDILDFKVWCPVCEMEEDGKLEDGVILPVCDCTIDDYTPNDNIPDLDDYVDINDHRDEVNDLNREIERLKDEIDFIRGGLL